MLITRRIIRCALCTPQIRAVKYNKDLLTKLQSKTGEDIYSCKIALRAWKNDFKKAEEWLHELAVRRAAIERSNSGLIAVIAHKKCAVMVDVKCENSSIAARSSFEHFTSQVARLCFAIAEEQNEFENSIAKLHLDSSQLNELSTNRGKKLKDEAADLISKVGGNIVLRRALCLRVNDELLVSGSASHPVSPFTSRIIVSMGYSGSLLVYKSSSKDRRIPVIAVQLCSHILGMKPQKIGNVKVDEPHKNELEEPCMIYQQFLVEPDLRVIDVLQSFGISLIEFTHFQCGEDIAVDENDCQPQKDIIGA